MKLTKLEALEILLKSSDLFKENLMDKMFLFILSDKQGNVKPFEVRFHKSNFKHLSGVKTELSATDFFNRCINRRLSEKDFEFANDGTTVLKLLVLPSLMTKNLGKANSVGDYNNSRPKLYTRKIAGSMKGCIGFKIDNTSGDYVPNTLLNEDIRNVTTDNLRIIATFRKYKNDKQYTECVYVAKNIDWSTIKLPKEYKYIKL